jgi:hypothetical protein
MHSQHPDDQVHGDRAGTQRSEPRSWEASLGPKPYEPPLRPFSEKLAKGLEIHKPIRQRMAARCQPLLPKEQIGYIIYCQRHSPYAMAVLPAQPRVIVVTQDHVWMIRVGTTWMNVLAEPMPSFLAPPKGIIAKLPRDTRIGPVSGLIWGRTSINGERVWIQRKFFRDVEAADDALESRMRR